MKVNSQTLLSLVLVLGFSMNVFAKTVLVDVRTPGEFSAGHIDGALNIDFKNENFETEIKKLSKEDTYQLYCRSGNRSGQALTKMTTWGYTHVENLGSMDEAKKKLGKN